MTPGFLIPRSAKSVALVGLMEGATSGTPSLLLFVAAFASNTGLFNPVLSETICLTNEMHQYTLIGAPKKTVA